jgi:hypothetical protein
MVKKKWQFTSNRRASLRKAQQVHKYLVGLGKRARARGMK